MRMAPSGNPLFAVQLYSTGNDCKGKFSFRGSGYICWKCDVEWCGDSDSVLYGVDVPFTPRNVLINIPTAVHEVENIDHLGCYLCVPRSKRQEIFHQFSSVLQQKSFIQYWMEHDPEASWRGLIAILDEMAYFLRKTADTICHLAEPVTGRTDSGDCVICTCTIMIVCILGQVKLTVLYFH